MKYLQCIDNPLVSSMIATKDIRNGHSQCPTVLHRSSSKGVIYANCSIMMFNEWLENKRK